MGVKGIGGIGAPTTVREWDLMSHGFLANFGVRRFPKGNEGKRVSSGYNRRRRLATRSSGKQQAERTAVRTAPIVCPEESPLVCPQAHTPAPVGIDAPTPARVVGLPPRGGVVLSFEAKESTKESTRHGDSEGGPRRYAPWASACGSPFGAVLGLGSLRSPAGKSPLMPIFERGSSQCRAQHSWIAITSYRARSCSLFSSFKKGKAFSLRCLSPPSPPRSA